MRDYIFIAGYGRSGSTILADYLAEALDGRHVGELSRFAEVLGCAEHYCSCGAPVRDCPYWSGLLDAEASYAEVGRGLWETTQGCVIDSSKRPAALRDMTWAFRGTGRLKVIVLSRSWAATKRSITRTHEIDPKAGVSKARHYRAMWISAVNRVFRQHAAVLLCRVFGVPFVRVDFDRLIRTSCTEEREKIENLIGRQISWTQRFPRRGHTFAGNRGRFSKAIAITFQP